MLTLLLFLQTPPAGDSVVVSILKAAAAIVIPGIAASGLAQLTKLVTLVANWPDWEKRTLVFVYGLVIAGISHGLGLSLPTDWGALGSADVQGLLSTAFAYLLYRIFKGPPPP